MTSWPEAVLLIGVGVVLRSVPRIVRVLWQRPLFVSRLRRRDDYLPISGRERRQMWAKDGTL